VVRNPPKTAARETGHVIPRDIAGPPPAFPRDHPGPLVDALPHPQWSWSGPPPPAFPRVHPGAEGGAQGASGPLAGAASWSPPASVVGPLRRPSFFWRVGFWLGAFIYNIS